MADRKRPTLMTPVSEEGASLTLVLEMLRGLDARLDSQNAASTEDRKLLHDIHIRVVQIESNQIQRRVEALAATVDGLKSDRDKRAGMIGLAEWMSKFGPWLLALALGLLAFVGFTRAS